jgi:CheY-like chemotaxis protein
MIKKLQFDEGPLRVLVVEDEALLMIDIEQIITDAGHNVIAEATSYEDVQQLDDDMYPDLALVDINLEGKPAGLQVAAYIRDKWKSTTVVFLTANPRLIPPDFAGASGVVSKPFTYTSLLSVLEYLERGVRQPPPNILLPNSLKLSPRFSELWH